MSSILIVDHHLDPVLLEVIEHAALLADIAIRRWEPGQDLSVGPAPRAIVCQLAHGARRLPQAVAHLADEVFPGTAVVLLSDEPLVQSWILLVGGRVTLVGTPVSEKNLSERLAAAVRWRDPSAPTFAVRRDDQLVGRGRVSVVTADLPGKTGDRLELNLSLGLTALLTTHREPGQLLAPDLLPTINAWQEQPDSAQLQRSLTARQVGAWSALAHLDPAAQRWLLATPGIHQRVTLISTSRLPGWWAVSDRGDGPAHSMAAEGGDVVLISSPLPDHPDFAPPALRAAAVNGAHALADHLAKAAKQHQACFAAAALELRS